MQKTLVIFKPSAMERGCVGQILTRFQQKGLIISGLKMMRLDEAILREHYSHLLEKPFFPILLKTMMASPVIVACLAGVDVINVVRMMTGATNGRDAQPGTIRGDFAMSNQENIIHASSSAEDADAEIRRFFKPEEIFEWTPAYMDFIYSTLEIDD
ncbi:MAG: nucleoside-diphosphate kinase [Paramuribaculum sp.]|nr:nucleoside-diphosphate kinase [Paramuribaculum sp.]